MMMEKVKQIIDDLKITNVNLVNNEEWETDVNVLINAYSEFRTYYREKLNNEL